MNPESLEQKILPIWCRNGLFYRAYKKCEKVHYVRYYILCSCYTGKDDDSHNYHYRCKLKYLPIKLGRWLYDSNIFKLTFNSGSVSTTAI